VTTPNASVVVTSYATPTPMLAMSIVSLLTQTVSEVEVVLVVDGALSVASEDLIGQMQRDDERLVVVRPGRVGRARALNLGLQTARAPLVGIQDADDASHPRRLEIQMALLEANPKLALLGTGARIIASLTETADWELDDEQPEVRTIARDILRSNPIVHSSVLARRTAVESVGGYDERRSAQFDYDLHLRLYTAGNSLGVTDVPLVLHRRHPDQFFEGLSPVGRAWGSCRLQMSYISKLGGPMKLGYYGIAGSRLVYQVGRGVAWRWSSRLGHTT
jgi:glycosyltransferase involved in cell wall biosynthesis